MSYIIPTYIFTLIALSLNSLFYCLPQVANRH